MNNNNTDVILNQIQKSISVKWTASHLKTISPGYKTSLKKQKHLKLEASTL